MGIPLSVNNSLFQKAKELYRHRNFTGAIKIYSELTLKYPKNHKAWNNLGLCYIRLENYDNAIVAFETALENDESSEIVWKNLGKAYYHMEEFEKVAQTYKKALEVFPESDFFWNGLGVVFNYLESYAQAIQAHKKALMVNPQNNSAWYNLCLAYCKTGVEFDPNEFKPNSEVSWYQLSKCLLISGLHQDSLFAINRCLELNPSYTIAHNLRSKIKSVIIEDKKLTLVMQEHQTEINETIEIDAYYERFKKLQEKRKKLLNDTKDQKELSLEEKFKVQQEEFKRKVKAINNTEFIETKIPPKPEEPEKIDETQIIRTLHKPVKKAKFICLDKKYYKIDDCNFVVDGANVAREDCNGAKKGKVSNLYKLFDKLKDFGIDDYLVICDRTLNYTIDNQEEYKHLVNSGKITETPGGTEADHFILKFAKEKDSYIISNDLFKEFRSFYGKEWIRTKRITFKIIQDKLYFDKIYTTT